MASKRPVVLMAILLVALGGYIAAPRLQAALFHSVEPADPMATADQPPLPGTNALSGAVVKKEADGRWMLHLDYFYTGAPKLLRLEVHQMVADSNPASQPTQMMTLVTSPFRGRHHYSTEVRNPHRYGTNVTTQVQVVLRDPLVRYDPRDIKVGAVAQATVDQRIQWPDPVIEEVEKSLAAGQPEAVVARAVALIDTNYVERAKEARVILQALVERSPRTDSAYVELARVAMKTNWSPAGLREAETLIRSALQIRPDSVDAKILLGYVLGKQEHYREAEALFVEAAATNPPNLWLWANWGELLAVQGRTDAALAKFREVLARPPTRDRNDRARQDAFERALLLVTQRKDADATEALHKQRTQDYPSIGCFSVDYARFLALERADGARASGVLREVPAPQCDAAETRQVQGLAYYVGWANGAEAGKAESLLQARAFLPASPGLFYALAGSDRTAKIAQQLIAAGDKVDVQDNSGFDALGHALRAGDAAVARRLLRLGAKPTAEEGAERMPAALIPVVMRDLEGVRMLQRAGVDYRHLRFQGMTALDVARGNGDRKLMLLLDPADAGA